MKALLMALLFGVSISATAYAQDKSDKSCCSSDKSKTTMSKICDVPDEVSISSDEEANITASIQGDDKNKKVDKNVKSLEKNVKKDKSKDSSSEDGCCTPETKKTKKTKSSDKS